MSSKRLLPLMAVALLALTVGCDQKKVTWYKPGPTDPAVEQSCKEEGYDPGTTEYADCLEELSDSN